LPKTAEQLFKNVRFTPLKPTFSGIGKGFC
jgi:hypothetical protein